MDILLNLIMRADFWIYAAMAIIFVSGLCLCVAPVSRVRMVMKRADKKLTVRRSDGSFIHDHPDFLECRAVNDNWARFLANLETMRLHNGTCDVNDFINEQTMIHEPGHSAYGAMIPGLLTTLGILGSFYGIVQGLSTLDLTSSEAMSNSIVVLISGMRTAFNTSIVGAVLGMCFQLIRRLVITRAENALRGFVRSCQVHMFVMISPEVTMMQTLHSILMELRRISRNGEAGRHER